MRMKKWTKEEDKILKKEYYDYGTDLSKKLNRSKKAIINRAFILRLKTRKVRKTKLCESCMKRIYPYGKYDLCKNCIAKKRYSRRGAFTHKGGKLWSNVEIEYLKENYYNSQQEQLEKSLDRNWSSICHKANRLKLKRNPIFMKIGNQKGRNTMITNNPMHNAEIKEKARKKLILLYKNHPEKLLNAKLKRNNMTSIEKKIADLLDELKINYEWNKYVRTSKTWRFPDFTIGKLILECDGEYWHKDKNKDLERQRELEEEGYTVLRFTDKEILNSLEQIKKCIQQELNLSQK